MLSTGALLGFPVSVPFLIAAFCGTALVYLLDRLGHSPEDRINRPGWIAWAQRHRAWVWGEGLFLCSGLVGSIPFLEPKTLGAAGILGGMALLHVAPVFSIGRGLKAMGLFKPIAVAGTWAVGAALLPVLEAGATATGPVMGLVAYRFFFILPNVLLCDWGDRAGDAAAGLHPWTEWGTARGLRLSASGLLVVAVVGALGGSVASPQPLLLWVDALGPALMLAAVWTVDPERPGHRLGLDLIVGWPAVTAGVAFGLG